MSEFVSSGHGVGIRAIGGYLPQRIVTNADLEKVFDTSDEWIRKHVGIRTRHWSASDEWTSDLGAAALRDACDRAGIGPDEIDLVICGTYSPEDMSPPAAVAIMRKVGMHGIPGFDVNSGGCAGGVFALDVGARYVQSGRSRRVAVVLSDVTTKMLDPEDRTMGVIFGDASACYLLEPCTPGLGVAPALLRSEPAEYGTASMKRENRTWPDGAPKQSIFGSVFAQMRGPAVRAFALDKIPGFVEEVLKLEGLVVDDLDLIVFHQANYVLIHELMERLGLPPERTVTNVERIGNTSGAGLPMALHDAIDAGRLRRGDVVLLISFGAGMSCGGTVIRWTGSEDFGLVD